jgi:hypothetical protein
MVAFSTPREGHDRCPVSDGNFEHLSHVAVNLPSLFVRAGDVSRFCSPNGQ